MEITKILVVEDDMSLSNGIVLALKNEHYDFCQCTNLQEARDAMRTIQFNLVLLDLNLPDGHGYDLLKEIRTKSELPVIILTANDLEMDEVIGLELGADDYITKPFSLMVLRVRISKALKKANPSTLSVYQYGDLVFDFEHMKYTKSNTEINLSKTEQKLLKILVDNKGITMLRTVLVDKLWTDGAEYVDENALSVTIKRLRNKIETDPSKPSIIQTVYGLGYVWKAE